jgi:hypothetical protein
MRLLKNTCGVALALAVTWISSGCATSDVNASKPKPHQGYVDFYCPSGEAVFWNVSRYDETAKSFRELHWDMEEPRHSILRLALPPGNHLLRVAANNVAVQTPVELAVMIEERKVLPVQVAFGDAVSMPAQTRDLGFGRGMKGPAGRRVRTVDRQTTLFTMTARVEPSLPFERKEQMPYNR